MHDPHPSHWRCKIIPNRKVVRIESPEDKASLLLGLAPARGSSNEVVEQLACSFVFVATGYTRNAHEEILKATRKLLPDVYRDDGFPVARNYRVEYDKEKVEERSGVWLQGCNENTHGVSKTSEALGTTLILPIMAKIHYTWNPMIIC
jgi:L-ornithine N5-oxygenase